MEKKELEALLQRELKNKSFWTNRYLQNAFNDNGKGGHIRSEDMMLKCDGKIEILNELLTRLP